MCVKLYLQLNSIAIHNVAEDSCDEDDNNANFLIHPDQNNTVSYFS